MQKMSPTNEMNIFSGFFEFVEICRLRQLRNVLPFSCQYTSPERVHDSSLRKYPENFRIQIVMNPWIATAQVAIGFNIYKSFICEA